MWAVVQNNSLFHVLPLVFLAGWCLKREHKIRSTNQLLVNYGLPKFVAERHFTYAVPLQQNVLVKTESVSVSALSCQLYLVLDKM